MTILGIILSIVIIYLSSFGLAIYSGFYADRLGIVRINDVVDLVILSAFFPHMVMIYYWAKIAVFKHR